VRCPGVWHLLPVSVREQAATGAEVADAIRSLAALVRSGMTVPRVLTVWHERAVPALHDDLRCLARRVALGQDPAEAVRSTAGLGAHAGAIALALDVHATCGGDLARTLDTVTRAAADGAAAGAHAASHSAGAKLSAKTVAVLPFAFIPLVGGDAPMFDPPGLALLLAGGGLTMLGMRWIARLSPAPPGESRIAAAALLLAAAVRGGASLWTALERIALASVTDGGEGPRPPDLDVARRRVHLGMSWSESLSRDADPDVAALGLTLRNAEELGVPVADALDRFAAAARSAAAARFEAAARRAPVKMIVPLTTCVLPGFCLLVLGPFLRGLAS